jgi:hypothetical protein
MLPDCYVTKRRSSKLHITQLSYPGYVQAMQDSVKLQMISIFIGMISSTQQNVPGWAGFISETGNTPKKTYNN